MSEAIECPECGKKSVVRHKEELYECLSCNFKRDLSEPPKSESKSDISDMGVLLMGLIAGLAAFFVLHTITTSFRIAQPEVKSSTTPAITQDSASWTLDN
ncbi:MAG: hypothetical protein LDL41_16195 [Coleofasciculus sp. S288]|nr:hypothetical protein [Coleofasciculus sp. S288]